MSALVLYYGTSAPDAEWARGLSDTDVVLQRYHPIVSGGDYRHTMPGARRFVYVNPTTIDPWRLARRSSRPPLRRTPDDWGLPRLDLEAAAGWDCAVEEAAGAASTGPDELDGVFVDDVDRLDTHDLVRFADDVSERLGWMPALFVNRGFAFWGEVTGVEAVLIEDVRKTRPPADDPDGPARWVREVVAPAVAGVRAAGARVHRIEYEDTADMADALEGEVSADLIDSQWMDAPRSLKAWPSGARGRDDR